MLQLLADGLMPTLWLPEFIEVGRNVAQPQGVYCTHIAAERLGGVHDLRTTALKAASCTPE